MVAQFDPNTIDFENLSGKQRQTLDYLRGLANRRPGAIGTSGLTGGEINAAGDIVEEAPTMMDTGYGPKEFNPQQRYEQRYQMRSGIVDEEGNKPFTDLQQSTAMGNLQESARESMPYTPSYSPDFMGGDGGDRAGGGYGGPGTLGSQIAQEMTPSTMALDMLSPIGTSALGYGALGGVFGGLPGALQGAGFGLKSVLTSPATMLGILDKAIGAAYGQHQLGKSLDALDLDREAIEQAQMSMEAFDPANLSQKQKMAREDMMAFDPTQRMSTRMLGGLASMLGLTDDTAGEGRTRDQAMDAGELSAAMDAENVADRFSNPALSSLEAYLGPSTYGAMQAFGMDRAPGGMFTGLSSTDVRELSSDELQDLMGRTGHSVMSPTPMTDAQSLSDLIGRMLGGGSEPGDGGFGGNVGSADGFGALGEAANQATAAAALGYGDSWGIGSGYGGLGGIGNMGPGSGNGGGGGGSGSGGGSGDGRGQGGDRGGGRSDGGGGYR